MFAELENWMFPPAPNHLDAPRASIRAVATPEPERAGSSLHRLKIEFIIRRPRTGDRKKSLANLVDLTVRAAHEKELFPPNDWEFIEWVTENFAADARKGDLFLSGQQLLQWLAHWGDESRLQPAVTKAHHQFLGQLAELTEAKGHSPRQLTLPEGLKVPVKDAVFFTGRPTLVLWNNTFYFLRNCPPVKQLAKWLADDPATPAKTKQPAKAKKAAPELATVAAGATAESEDTDSSLNLLKIEFYVQTASGPCKKSLAQLTKLIAKGSAEKEQFAAADWEFMEWATGLFGEEAGSGDLFLAGPQLLQWLAHWGEESRLLPGLDAPQHRFMGQLTELSPSLRNGTAELAFTHQLRLPDGTEAPIQEAVFFAGRPTLVLWNSTFYFLRNSPPAKLLTKWVANPRAPITKLSTRFITALRRSHHSEGVDWSKLVRFAGSAAAVCV